MMGVIHIALTSGHLKGTYMKGLKRYAQVGMMAGTVLGSRTDVTEPVEVLEDANRSLRRELAENHRKIGELQEMIKELQGQIQILAEKERIPRQQLHTDARGTRLRPPRSYVEVEEDENEKDEEYAEQRGEQRFIPGKVSSLQEIQTIVRKEVAAEIAKRQKEQNENGQPVQSPHHTAGGTAIEAALGGAVDESPREEGGKSRCTERRYSHKNGRHAGPATQ